MPHARCRSVDPAAPGHADLEGSAPMTATSSSAPGFAVLVPVKRTAVAKSRLRGLGDAVRRDLASAFAADTVAAALASERVAGGLAGTHDPALAGGRGGGGGGGGPRGAPGPHRDAPPAPPPGAR